MSTRAKKSVSKMLPRSRTLYNLLQRDWDGFSSVCVKRWSKIKKDLLAENFDKSLVLGSGYFGVVLSTNNKKLVVKVTSDHDEGYFNRLILSDEVLRYSPGLPYVIDCFFIPEWDAYVILRENINYGVPDLPESSPLMRAIPILDRYGERVLKIESDASKILQSKVEFHANSMYRRDFESALRDVQGSIRVEIIKTLKGLPQTSESSRFYFVMEVLKHSLDKYGIALWDLHNLNLGKHKFDMREFDQNIFELDTKSILISDVGGNFGSPVLDSIIESVDV